jgi:hypothetical protein
LSIKAILEVRRVPISCLVHALPFDNPSITVSKYTQHFLVTIPQENYCKHECSMYHKTWAGHSFGTSFAGVKKWLGLVRTPKVPVSQSAIDPLRRRLFHPRRRPALAIPYYISLLTPQPQTHLTNTNNPPTPPTNNHPEESQLRTASASSPLRAYSLTSLSPTAAGPGRRNHVESQEQRHHTKRSLIRHPRATCRYRASRYSILREIAVPPDLQRTTGKFKRKNLQH